MAIRRGSEGPKRRGSSSCSGSRPRRILRRPSTPRKPRGVLSARRAEAVPRNATHPPSGRWKVIGLADRSLTCKPARNGGIVRARMSSKVLCRIGFPGYPQKVGQRKETQSMTAIASRDLEKIPFFQVPIERGVTSSRIVVTCAFPSNRQSAPQWARITLPVIETHGAHEILEIHE